MKKLGFVLLLLAFVPAPNPPFVTAQASSVYTTSSTDTLYSIACDPGCGAITYSWAKISGPGVQTVGNGTTNAAIVSGLQSGFYVFQSTVTSATTGLAATDTVGFLVNIPIYITLPPIIKHDTIAATVLYPTFDGKAWHYYFNNGTVQ